MRPTRIENSKVNTKAIVIQMVSVRTPLVSGGGAIESEYATAKKSLNRTKAIPSLKILSPLTIPVNFAFTPTKTGTKGTVKM